ncbi:MAG: heme biosynthesis protein HemY [Alphaproteobacteria bacterium]
MIRALIFFLKLAALSLLAVWVASREGSVRLNWKDMEGADIAVTVDLGLFLLLGLIIILIALFIFKIMSNIAHFPQSWARYRDFKRREKGFRALTLGLTAVAAGDKKIAAYQAYRTEKLLPELTALGILLNAQAARLSGDEEAANAQFELLAQDKDAAFLGVRGLLQSALDQKDFEKALDIAQKASKLQPKQHWILKVVLDLEIRARECDNALKTLYRLEKLKAIPIAEAASIRSALMIAQADQLLEEGNQSAAKSRLEKAYGYSPHSIPVVTRLVEILIERKQRRRAIQIIEKVWKHSPHPDLVPLWAKTAPKPRRKSSDIRLGFYMWLEKLLSVNANSAEGQMAIAEAAIDIRLWGEARSHLNAAEALRPSKRLYILHARLDEKSGRGAEAVQNHLKQADNAAPDYVWHCRETGRVYERWSAYAPPHNSFNTITWGVPEIHSDYSAIALDSASPRTALMPEKSAA